MSNRLVILSACIVLLGFGACMGPAVPPGEHGPGSTPAARSENQPTELQDCLTAVGAERAQCRAK